MSYHKGMSEHAPTHAVGHEEDPLESLQYLDRPKDRREKHVTPEEHAKRDAEAMEKAWKALEKHTEPEAYAREGMRKFLMSLKESVAQRKEYFKSKKEGKDKNNKTIEQRVNEKDVELQTVRQKIKNAEAKIDREVGQDKLNLFSSGKEYHVLKKEEERLEHEHELLKAEKKHIDDAITDLEKIENDLKNADSISKIPDIKVARAKTQELNAKVAAITHSMSKDGHDHGHGHEPESFWQKVKSTFVPKHMAMVAGAGFMGVFTWYLGVVWGDMTGGWKGLGKKSGSHGGGGHGGHGH